MKTIEKSDVNLKISIVGIFFVLSFSVICAKAVHVQAYQNAWLSQKAAGEYEQSFTSFGKRGTIFDTTGRELAVSAEVVSVAAYPRRIKDPHTTARVLSGVLESDTDGIYESLTSKRSFAWIKRQISPRQAEAVKTLDLEGVDFISEHSRFYPNRSLAAQVVGFSGIDERGLDGIEFHYNDDLKGSDQRFKIITDALGRGFESESPNTFGVSGHNIVLTIDRTIQYITEKALEEAVVNFSAKSGVSVVMDPKTGAVLAMANYPQFNPNRYKDFGKEIWRNRCVTDAFEPGSTMKIFSAAAAIESKICTPNTIFYCENGQYSVGSNVVHDTKSHGWLPLHKIVKYSSNIGAVKISQTIGSELMYNTLKAFGFGEKTGIDCPGESSGRLSSYQKWSKIDAGTIAFGHGISVTAIQLTAAVSAIANDGLLMKPYIVQSVRDEQGNMVSQFGPKPIRQSISPETARTITQMMMTVIEDGGTGTNARLSGYTACGKTGTSQKTNRRGEYTNENYIGSFVGFAPVENPKVAILVVIDEPKKNYYGGLVAAPAFKKIAEATLNYMNVPPNNTSDKLTIAHKNEANG